MEFISSTGLVGVALLNAACVLNAGFRSFQALQRRSAVGKGGAKVASVADAHLPRVPALPQLSSSDEDGEEAERNGGGQENLDARLDTLIDRVSARIAERQPLACRPTWIQ